MNMNINERSASPVYGSVVRRKIGGGKAKTIGSGEGGVQVSEYGAGQRRTIATDCQDVDDCGKEGGVTSPTQGSRPKGNNYGNSEKDSFGQVAAGSTRRCASAKRTKTI